MEGLHLDPGLYLYEFGRYGQAHLLERPAPPAAPTRQPRPSPDPGESRLKGPPGHATDDTVPSAVRGAAGAAARSRAAAGADRDRVGVPGLPQAGGGGTLGEPLPRAQTAPGQASGAAQGAARVRLGAGCMREPARREAASPARDADENMAGCSGTGAWPLSPADSLRCAALLWERSFLSITLWSEPAIARALSWHL